MILDQTLNACRRFSGFALIALLLAAPAAFAHSVWVENAADQKLVVRFGEFGGKVEGSPGYLDSLSAPVAWTSGEEGKSAAIVVQKNADHFLLTAAKTDAVVFVETGFPVMGKEGKPGTKPFFFVRWQPAGAPIPAAPSLTLDLVPTATAGEYRVYFRGQPLAGAKVVSHGANEKEETLTTDDAGRVRVPLTQGLNLITANHREAGAGFAAGREFERTSYNVALSWRQP